MTIIKVFLLALIGAGLGAMIGGTAIYAITSTTASCQTAGGGSASGLCLLGAIEIGAVVGMIAGALLLPAALLRARRK